MAYRVEISANKRAGCQDTECKRKEIKIQKGELRFGTWVDIQGHGSWRWKHWGCVTPKVISNWAGICEKNPDLIDGFNELDETNQRKILTALDEGHVAAEDWKHDPDFNTPGSTKRRAPKRKRKGDEADGTAESAAEDSPSEKKSKIRRSGKKEEDTADVAETQQSGRKRGRPRKVKVENIKDEVDPGEDAAEPEKAKSSRGRSKKVKKEEDSTKGDDAPSAPKRVKERSKRVKEEAESENEEEPVAPKRGRRRSKKVKDESEGEEEVDFLNGRAARSSTTVKEDAIVKSDPRKDGAEKRSRGRPKKVTDSGPVPGSSEPKRKGIARSSKIKEEPSDDGAVDNLDEAVTNSIKHQSARKRVKVER